MQLPDSSKGIQTSVQEPNTLFRLTNSGVVTFPNTFLRVTTFSSQSDTLEVETRILNKSRNIIPSGNVFIATGTLRTAVNTDIQLHDGVIASVIVRQSTSDNNTIQRGQIFVRCILFQGNPSEASSFPLQILFSDYVTTNVPIGFPFTGIQSSLAGTGYSFTKRGSIVEAGNVVHTITVPANTVWKFGGGLNFLQNAASAGNRFAVFQILDASGNIIFQIQSLYATIISGTTYYLLLPISAVYTPLTAITIDGLNDIYLPCPLNLKLTAGFQIINSITNGVAGDAQSSIYYLEEFLDV